MRRRGRAPAEGRPRICDLRVIPLTRRSLRNRDFEYDFWSGARDLNPGPHGPESHDSSSNHVGFCIFQFDSPSRRARSVQIGTNLQPDYYMKYYRKQVVQTASSEIKRCYRPGIGRRQQLWAPS